MTFIALDVPSLSSGVVAGKGTTMPEQNHEEQQSTIEEQERRNRLLERSVDDLELSVRTANCLQLGRINTVRDLLQRTEADLMKLKNFGRKSLKELREMVAEDGLKLGELAERQYSGVVVPSAPQRPAPASAALVGGPPPTPASAGWVSTVPTRDGLMQYAGSLLGAGAPLTSVQYRELAGGFVETRTMRLTTTGMVWRTHLSTGRKQPGLTTAGTAWLVHELHQLQWQNDQQREAIDRLCLMLMQTASTP